MTDYITPTITTTTTNVDIFGDNYATQRESLVAEYGDFEISSGSLYLNDSTRGSLYVAGENSFVCNTFSIFDSYANKQEGTANNISIGYISGVPTIKLNTSNTINIIGNSYSNKTLLNMMPESAIANALPRTVGMYMYNTYTKENYLTTQIQKYFSLISSGNSNNSTPLPLRITANSSFMQLSPEGYIGINTTTPGYTLDVYGDLNVSGSSTFNSPTTFNTTTILGNFWDENKSSRLKFQSNVIDKKTRLSIAPSGTGTISSLDIYNGSDLDNSELSSFYIGLDEISIRSVAANNTSNILPLRVYMVQDKDNIVKPTSTLSLTSSGVGINTKDPTSGYALDVHGLIKADSYTVSGRSGFLKADGTVDSSTYLTSIDGSGIKRLTFDYDTTSKKGIQGTTTTTSTAVLGITAGLLDNLSSGSSIFMYGNQTTSKQNSMDIWGTNTSTSVLSINYFNGGVGINTNNPTSGYALDVNGNLSVSGYIRPLNGLYIFKNLYIPTWLGTDWDYNNATMLYYNPTVAQLFVGYNGTWKYVQLV